MERCYSFMSLDAESLRLAPAWQEADRAFFDATRSGPTRFVRRIRACVNSSPTTQTCSSSYAARHAAQSIVARW